MLAGSVLPLAAQSPAATQAVRGRLVSPSLAAMLAASMPRYTPPTLQSTAAPRESPVLSAGAEKPKNEIVRLPSYVVRAENIPSRRDVLTKKGIEDWMMNKYMGSYDDLDRGVLNRFTIGELWAKIPILGKLPFFGAFTNEARAMAFYYEVEIPAELRALESFDALSTAEPIGGGQPQLRPLSEITPP